jgi:type II secretory pathway component PulM
MPKGVKTKINKTIRKATKKVKRASARPTKKSVKLEQERHIKDIKEEMERTVRAERDKRMILWTGVTFFMAVIFIFWIFNLKSTFKQIESENVGDSDFNWNEITDGFGKTMDEMKENLAEIKEFAETADEASTSTENTISTTTRDIFSDQEEIGALKARLEELESKLGTSSPENDIE